MSLSPITILNYKFTLNELKSLYRILEKQWINQDDREAHETINRISRIIRESDGNMARGNSQST